jgi:hypothetical protein
MYNKNVDQPFGYEQRKRIIMRDAARYKNNKNTIESKFSDETKEFLKTVEGLTGEQIEQKIEETKQELKKYTDFDKMCDSKEMRYKDFLMKYLEYKA